MEGFGYNFKEVNQIIHSPSDREIKKAIPFIDLLSSGVQKTENRQKDNKKDDESDHNGRHPSQLSSAHGPLPLPQK